MRWTRNLGLMQTAMLLLTPLLVTVWLSFSSDSFFSLPVTQWSTRWYQAAWNDPRWRDSFARSLLTASLAGLLCVSLALPAALALVGKKERSLVALLVLPACLPPVSWAMGLLPLVGAWPEACRMAVLVMAQALLGLPVALLALRLRVDREWLELVRTARGLGATPYQALLRVGIPRLMPALIAAFLLATTLAFHEPVLCLFLCPPNQETLPAVAWPTLRSSLTPVVAAVATLTMALGLLVAGLVAWLWNPRRGGEPATDAARILQGRAGFRVSATDGEGHEPRSEHHKPGTG